MIVPHAAHVGVSPQREYLANDGHPAQRAVNELHDIGIAHFLQMERTDRAPLVRPSFSHCFLPISKGLFGREPALVAAVTISASTSLRRVKLSMCAGTDQYSWGCRLPAGVQSQAGVNDEAGARSPWKCQVHGENKGVRSPPGSPLKQRAVEPGLLALISSSDLHLVHRPGWSSGASVRTEEKKPRKTRKLGTLDSLVLLL